MMNYSKSNHIIYLTALLFLLPFLSYSQVTTVSGKIIDADSGDPIPFVNVVFKGSTNGTSTDFDGYYSISTRNAKDTLTASYIGYVSRSKPVRIGEKQIINFQLSEETIGLDEVVFTASENPAFPIMRNVILNKKRNDKRSLSAFEYENYTKIEIDIDQISEELKQKKMWQQISQMMDSLETIAGEDGKPILPLFISESISQYYQNNNPELRKENLIKSKITGVGVEDASFVSQFLGTSYQQYNFYQNWMTIVKKEFISPIADGWKGYYDYYLTDSLMVDGHFCYKIEVFPKRKEDLAFTGIIWITKKEYALRQIDVSIPKSANLNYIEKIKIQQKLEPTEAGAWIPGKTRVLIDVSEISKKSAGMLFKFYMSNKDFVVNKPHDNKFFTYPIEIEADFREQKEDYWMDHRHDSLTLSERNVYAMIDTLKNIPKIKTYVDIFEIIVSGYFKAGMFDIGPYLSLLAINNVEGNRFRIGFKTNIDFSDKWVLKGYAAYGTRDERFKYGGSAQYFITKKPWTTVTVGGSYEIEQVGISKEALKDNPIFFAATRNGDLRRPYLNSEGYLSLQTDVRKGLTQRVTLRYNYFDPLFTFAYKTDPSSSDSPLASQYGVSEIQFTTRFAKDEIMVYYDNERRSIGNRRWPIFTLNYTYGVKGLFGGDLEYHRLSFNVKQSLKMGKLGRSFYSVTAGHDFSNVPYPLLSVHLGNESVFFSSGTFNLMNFFEFVSDSYVSVKYQHKFDGLILNRIPLMRKLKWRLVGVANALYGGIRQENIDIIPEFNEAGEPVPGFNSLEDKPYVEVGYGIENIFKVIRIDAYHRLTYLDNPDISKFAVKINFQFIL